MWFVEVMDGQDDLENMIEEQHDVSEAALKTKFAPFVLGKN